MNLRLCQVGIARIWPIHFELDPAAYDAAQEYRAYQSVNVLAINSDVAQHGNSNNICTDLLIRKVQLSPTWRAIQK